MARVVVRLQAYLAALDPRYPALLARAEATATVVTNASLEPWEASLSSQLYYVMVMLFRDAAQGEMSTVPPGEGLEARRQAILDWDPKIRTRKAGLLIKVLTAKFSGGIPQSLDQFEHLVRECEGQAGKPFDEDLEIGIVIVNMVDTTVQQRLVKNSARLETWMAMKEVFLEMAGTEQHLNSQPRPMELGATPKGKKGDGKRQEGGRKRQRGRREGKVKGSEPKGKAKVGAAEKDCWYCGKKGHIAAECKKNAKDAKGKKKLAATPELPGGSDTAAPRAALLLDRDEGPKRVMADAGAGASVCPTSFDAAATADASVKPAAPATATGEEVRLRDGRWSHLQAADGAGVALRHSSSEQVTVPVVSASDACDAGNWLVFGPMGSEGGRAKQIPFAVTQAEWDSHQLTHQPFRSRRDHCASGKATEDPHALQELEAEGAVPRISVDYRFLTSKRDEQEMHAVLNVLDAKSGGPLPGMVNQKGEDDYALALMSEAVRFCGRTRMLLLSDGERPINRLVDVFIETRSSKHSASKRNTPKGSSQSAGLIERSNYEVEKQYRALKHRLESVYKQVFPLSDKIQPWLVRHAGWLLVRFLVKADGKTPYSQSFGKDNNGEIMEFGECVHHKSPLSSVGKADDRTIAGLPTLHEPGLVAAAAGTAVAELPPFIHGRGDPEVAPINVDWSKEYFSTKAGVKLGPQKACEAKIKEMRDIDAYEVKQEGFVMIVVVPMVFVHHELDISLGCHGDDFQAEAEKEALDELDKIMQRHFEVKIPPRIGSPEHGGQAAELKHLKRTIRWRLVFRTAAGTLQYLAEDVPSVKFTTSTVTEGMTTPTKMHALRLHRCVRYLLDHPSEIWIFAYQKMPTHLTEHCDSDWAADRETRKSMSCVVERFGEHLIDMSASTKQSLLALSSGEAEFYAIIKGAATGVQTTQIIEALTRLPCKL
ncbi:unnamed protein product, partial [Prorocentrum cordatum]